MWASGPQQSLYPGPTSREPVSEDTCYLANLLSRKSARWQQTCYLANVHMWYPLSGQREHLLPVICQTCVLTRLIFGKSAIW